MQVVRNTQLVRIVVVSPHSLNRLGLVRILESIEGVEVVAHAADTADGARLADTYRPDVVLLDAELAADESMTAVGTVKNRVPDTRILMLADRAVHSQVQQALEAGADGYTLKDITIADLASALRRVATGDTVLHPEAAWTLARRYAQTGREKTALLTPRQREILMLLASGLENKQIARRLGIGVHTVKTHVSRVLTKLGASSRTEAVVVAMRDRLIS